jgi:hypothetical protein
MLMTPEMTMLESGVAPVAMLMTPWRNANQAWRKMWSLKEKPGY